MAENGPDELEDGESYLPSGILVGDDGWAGSAAGGGCGGGGGGGGGGNSERRMQLLQRQSFFSDGVGGLPCYPPEVARAAVEPPPTAMAAAKGGRRVGCVQNQRPPFPASRPHLQEGFDMSCLYGAVALEAAPGFGIPVSGAPPALGRVLLSPDGGVYTVGSGLVYPFHPVKLGCGQAENCAKMAQRQAASVRFVSSGRVPRCGGTGVFLPLPQHQNETWKSSRGKGDGAAAAAAAQGQQSKHKPAGVAKQGMPFQGRRERGLPQDWTY